MPIELTVSQQQALDSQDQPVDVVDPRTRTRYVLIRAEDFESVREILEEERRQQAIRAVGLRNAVGRMHDDP